VALFVIYWRLVRDIDPFHKSLIAVSALLLGLAVLSAWLGLPMTYSLFVLLAAPVAVVIGYEWKGHKHVEAQRVRLEQ
jgi:Flp pilus assembly protein TadB